MVTTGSLARALSDELATKIELTQREARVSSNHRYHHGDLANVLRSVAAELIAERGVEGFSLREVARRAGVSHGAPAHHFGSARGLLTAVAAEGFKTLASRLAEARTGSDEASVQLRAASTAYVQTALAYPGHYSVMFADHLHAGDDGELVEAARASFDQLTRVVEAITVTNPSLDVETAAILTWSMMAGLVQVLPILNHDSSKSGEPELLIDDLIDFACSTLERGLQSTVSED